ncbi:MAG: pyridoxal-phosphate-dependent aminotransferase family protein [Syntrophomonadaceae bacterium]
MIGEQYLLLPGPTPVPERVVRAMSKPLVNHRGPEFMAIVNEVTENVKRIYQTKGHLLIYPASGTGAMEAAVVNFISPGDKVLSISIGVFGDRFAQIAQEFGADVEKLDFPWGEAADPNVVAERVKKDSQHEIKAVLITHNETSTGVFNDVKAIREAMGDHPALFIVDAVSSLVAMDLKMDEWNVDVVVSGSQKAFMIPPGLSFIGFNDRALEIHKKSTNRKFYWSITKGLQYLQKSQNPFTPPISLYYGLQESLKMLFEEGLEKVLARHKNYRDMVRSAVREMGLSLLAQDEVASPAVTAVVAPGKKDANKIRKYMLDEFNIALAGGQQSLDDVIIRIGHLGYVRELDLLSVIAAMEIGLQKIGHPITLGKGVGKAQEYISRWHAV